MAGRGRGGRGRGRAAVPPSVAHTLYNNFGDRRQENAPSSNYIEPSQKFPPMLVPEAPDAESFTERERQTVEYFDQLEKAMKQSVFYRPVRSVQYKIDRYSDRYLGNSAGGAEQRISSIQTTVSFLPDELQLMAGFGEGGVRVGKAAGTLATGKSVSFDKTLLKLDAMAKNEELNEEKIRSEEDNENNDEDGSDGAVFEEEDFEDDTDYNLSYFDNGEEYGGGDYDDGDGEAVF